MSKQKNVAAAAAVEATQTIAPDSKESDWIKLASGYTVKFIKVPAFLYQTGQAHLRKMMRQNKPKPPTVNKPGQRPFVNDRDPDYLAEITRWEYDAEDYIGQSAADITVLSGMKVKEDMPDISEWMPDVLRIVEPLGMTEEDVLGSFVYQREQMAKLAFRKYIVLADEDDAVQFTLFHNKKLRSSGIDEDFAIDMFRPDQE